MSKPTVEQCIELGNVALNVEIPGGEEEAFVLSVTQLHAYTLAALERFGQAEPVAWRHSKTHALYDLEEQIELADADEYAEPLCLGPQPDRVAELGAAEHRANALAEECERLRKALEFYADGNHFVRHDDAAWDTVSGEPQNFFEDDANTATVEDGSVAKAALAARADVEGAGHAE